jgi:hemerythrin-like domain-containing protein
VAADIRIGEMNKKGDMDMIPIGPLMIEHRLIERVIKMLPEMSKRMTEKGELEPLLIDMTVDFIRMYADRTHHGKEEEILFRDLSKRNLTEEDHRFMGELVDEHVYARQTVRELMAAKERYLKGDKGALAIIKDKMEALFRLYPEHIRKEDKVFFPASMKCFSREEQEVMLKEMWEFDRGMIHEKYKIVAATLDSMGK